PPGRAPGPPAARQAPSRTRQAAAGTASGPPPGRSASDGDAMAPIRSGCAPARWRRSVCTGAPRNAGCWTSLMARTRGDGPTGEAVMGEGVVIDCAIVGAPSWCYAQPEQPPFLEEV